MTLEYDAPVYRGGQEGFMRFATEATGMISPATNTLATAPTSWANVGYIDVPSFDLNENPGVIETAGAYRAQKLIKGRREITIRNNLRIGNYSFLQYALRSSGLGSGGFKGLPVLALQVGAHNAYGSGFNWVARHAIFREIGLSFQEGAQSPLTANIELWPVAVQFDGANVSVTESDLTTAGGEVLCWQHAEWIVDGISYRNILKSIQIRVTNNIERAGMRRDRGDTNPLSRCPYQINLLNEQISINYTLRDKLPLRFLNTVNDSNNMGVIKMLASDVDAGGSKAFTTTIFNNRLAQIGMQGVAPGAELSFNGSNVSAWCLMEAGDTTSSSSSS